MELGKLTLAERLDAVHQTLNEHGAPTHDANGAKLNANGRLVDYLDKVLAERDHLQAEINYLVTGESR